MAGKKALIEARDVCQDFPIKEGLLFPRQVGTLHAVNKVSLSVYEGETLALVGQSGAGKTTLGMMMLGLVEPTSGEIVFDGQNIFTATKEQRRKIVMETQLIFQDPLASLNPQVPIGRSIELPLLNLGWEKAKREARVRELLDMVSLNPSHASRYPHQFSGGQAQRIAIARAIAGNPKFIVLDEPVSALDVTIQAQIINLLKDLQADLGLTYLFIAHNLAVVYYLSDRVAVMYQGELVEIGDCDDVILNPRHEHTRELVASSS
jgi:ABC-type oligopeptide transport system ATPase subunit